jgi:hypothetical protein
MAKFTDENKEVKEFNDSNWLGFGVHHVQIATIGLDKTEDGGKEFIEIGVVGENGEEDTARVWFTTDAAINYSFNVLRQIYVHNAPEAKKDAARDAMDRIMSTEELVDELQAKLLGGNCWFTKYPDPSRTYVNAAGETKPSINKNVYGYEPKPRPDLLPKDTEELTKDNLAQHFPGSEPATGDAAKDIPEKW